MNFKRLVVAALFCSSLMPLAGVSAFAQDVHSQTSIEVAHDIFMKGSIDGKHTWIVLGVEEGFRMAKETLEHTVDSNELLNLRNDFYDPKHVHDVYGAALWSKDNARKYAPNILNRPWKSIEGIPQVFRVNFEKANDAYYHTDSPLVGSMKYSGWAVWTMIEGAFYLVIEAPSEAVFSTLETGVKVAGPLILSPLMITWDATKVAFPLVFCPIVAAAVGGYSVISSSTSAVASLVYSGGVATFNGMKWMVYDLPRYSIYPVLAEFRTEFGVDSQQALADSLVSQWELRHGFSMTPKLGKYQSRIDLRFNGDGRVSNDTNFGVIQVYPVNGKLMVRGEISRAYIKALSVADKRSFKETKADLQRSMEEDLAEMVAKSSVSTSDAKN
ncbi:MAG: hypothetical protein ABIQ95_17420 [Bdellovibrionia bacterium]